MYLTTSVQCFWDRADRNDIAEVVPSDEVLGVGSERVVEL